MKGCKCANWASVNMAMELIANHKVTCENYPGDIPVLKTLIKDLVKGIECWSADTDGIHDELWDAYCKANYLIHNILLLGEKRR